MKSLRVLERAWLNYQANLSANAKHDLAFGVLIGQTDNSGYLVYDVLPLAPFKPQTGNQNTPRPQSQAQNYLVSKEFADYIKAWNESGNNLGEWLNETLMNIKMMQVTGIRLIGLVISSTLQNFKISNDAFINHLSNAGNFMPSQNEVSILLMDSAQSKLDQAVIVDLGKRKVQNNKFSLEAKLDPRVFVKTRLTLSRIAVASFKSSEAANSQLITEQTKDYSSRINYFTASYSGAILSSKQTLESLQKDKKEFDEIQLDLYYDEPHTVIEKKSDSQKEAERRAVTIDGSLELTCYVSPKTSVSEILTILAKDFVESFNARVELATFEDKSFDIEATELQKAKTAGFNLARRVFLRLDGHPNLLYQDYLSPSETIKDSLARILDFTSIKAQALGDFEVSELRLLGESLPKKVGKKEEVKMEEITSRKTDSTQPVEKPKETPSPVKDSSENLKKIFFIVVVLVALIAVRFLLF